MTLDSLLAKLLSSLTSVRSVVVRHPWALLIVLIGIVAGTWFLLSRPNTDQSLIVVSEKPFLQQVAASGKVKASDDVAMTFERTGRVRSVNVSVGDEVKAGRTLATLSSGTLEAELAAARAEVASRRAARENSAVNLEKVRAQENAKVDSAYRSLLSTDLVALPRHASYEVDAPTITGLYAGTTEGTYQIRIDRAQVTLDTYDLHVKGLEEGVAPVRISKTGPTALGTHGLYISFPDSIGLYNGTAWTVSVPNQRSATYATRYNAYQEALRDRDQAISQAQEELVAHSGTTAIADAQLLAAQAEVQRLLAELAAYSLVAPFDGVVTAVDIGPGDTAGPETPAIALISNGRLEIESFIPEINISAVSVGDKATVTLDAYGEGVPFEAVVAAIDPAETIRDGVSTYRVRLAFVADDERLLSGMTANIVITTDERPAVLTVPQGAVTRSDGATYVTVMREGKKEKRMVVAGAISSLGEIEILSGLLSGETIAAPAP